MASRYPLAEIQALARSGCVIFANRRAERNALELGWTMETVVALVCGLKARHHRGIRRELSIFNGRDTIDADKYVARFDEDALVVTVDRQCCEFFIELASKTLHSGVAVLVISLHLDMQP